MTDGRVRLSGITWDHPRGFDPLVATAEAYGRSHPAVEIHWEKRSLQAFADHPLVDLASRFDLLVIDHPHVGRAARHDAILALDEKIPVSVLRQLAAESVGRSHESYQWDGHQWALAIDAAAQVAAWRPDILPEPPTTWVQVLQLAKEDRVLWPLKPVDAICSFFTLAANRGTHCAASEDLLIGQADGIAILESMLEVSRHLPRECFAMNPIDVADWLSRDQRYCYSPLLFGYSNYARAEFRQHVLRYTNIPDLARLNSSGSILGGTGIAVSSTCKDADVAVDYASWVAGADCQKALYFRAGGQPANAVAWDDPTVNAACSNFFRDTRMTLEGAWLRPRYDGFLDVQEHGGEIVHRVLVEHADLARAVDELNQVYRSSRAS